MKSRFPAQNRLRAITEAAIAVACLAVVPGALADTTDPSGPAAAAIADRVATATAAPSGSATAVPFAMSAADNADDSAERHSGWDRTEDVQTGPIDSRGSVLEVPRTKQSADRDDSPGDDEAHSPIGSIDDYQDEELPAGVFIPAPPPPGSQNPYGIQTDRGTPGINPPFQGSPSLNPPLGPAVGRFLNDQALPGPTLPWPRAATLRDPGGGR